MATFTQALFGGLSAPGYLARGGRSGEELSRRWFGVRNRPGLDPSDALSFGIDTVTDPLVAGDIGLRLGLGAALGIGGVLGGKRVLGGLAERTAGKRGTSVLGNQLVRSGLKKIERTFSKEAAGTLSRLSPNSMYDVYSAEFTRLPFDLRQWLEQSSDALGRVKGEYILAAAGEHAARGATGIQRTAAGVMQEATKTPATATDYLLERPGTAGINLKPKSSEFKTQVHTKKAYPVRGGPSALTDQLVGPELSMDAGKVAFENTGLTPWVKEALADRAAPYGTVDDFVEQIANQELISQAGQPGSALGKSADEVGYGNFLRMGMEEQTRVAEAAGTSRKAFVDLLAARASKSELKSELGSEIAAGVNPPRSAFQKSSFKRPPPSGRSWAPLAHSRWCSSPGSRCG